MTNYWVVRRRDTGKLVTFFGGMNKKWAEEQARKVYEANPDELYVETV